MSRKKTRPDGSPKFKIASEEYSDFEEEELDTCEFEEGEPDWEFFLPDVETFPEPGDFWIEDDYDEAA